MRCLNKVMLIGRLGKNPEIRSTQNNKEIASFSIVTSERWLDKSTGLYKEKADWHNIVIFSDPIVRIVKEYVRKGSAVYIEGSIKTRDYVDSDGKKRYVTEIHILNFSGSLIMLDSQQKTNNFSDKSESTTRNSFDSPKESSSKESDTSSALGDAGSFMDDFTDDEIPF